MPGSFGGLFYTGTPMPCFRCGLQHSSMLTCHNARVAESARLRGGEVSAPKAVLAVPAIEPKPVTAAKRKKSPKPDPAQSTVGPPRKKTQAERNAYQRTYMQNKRDAAKAAKAAKVTK